MSLSEEELTTLKSRAVAAKSTAYAPYSHFRVGACILTSGGEYIPGANVENVSFPVGTCAERVAMGSAVVAGYHEQGFRAIAVASDIKPGASPCGMCRQFMKEFTTPSFLLYMVDGEGSHVVRSMGELLPDSFGPNDLQK